MAAANTLAYYDKQTITAVKKFKVQAPGDITFTLLTFVILLLVLIFVYNTFSLFTY